MTILRTLFLLIIAEFTATILTAPIVLALHAAGVPNRHAQALAALLHPLTTAALFLLAITNGHGRPPSHHRPPRRGKLDLMETCP